MIEEIISLERLGKYLNAAGHDTQKAVELYAWNIELSQAFFPLLSAVEVSLRNIISNRLCEVFEDEWWENADFYNLAGKKTKGIVLRARDSRERNKGYVTKGCMTSELNFGYWTKMLLPKYKVDLWTPLPHSFPHLPAEVDLSMLEQRANDVCRFRNRVFHHEPIFDRNLTKDYSEAMELTRWLSPAKADWIKPRCNAMSVLRRRPR